MWLLTTSDIKKNNRLPQPADHETIAIYDTKAYNFRETFKAETNYRPQRITGRIGNFRQHMIKERNKTITKTKWHNAQLRTIRGTQTREKKRNTVSYDRLYIICNVFPMVELSSNRTFRKKWLLRNVETWNVSIRFD